jgi:hypothetical protein
MAKTITRTILLKGRGYRMERAAGGTIKPGSLVQLTSTNTLVVAATALLKYATFAVEDDHNGKDIDTNYVVNDYVQAETLTAGCEVNALLAAAATAIVVGSQLEAAADGTVRLRTTGIQIGVALEAVDNSAGGTQVRLRIMLT